MKRIEKLTAEHLVIYLAYGLKCKSYNGLSDSIDILMSIYSDFNVTLCSRINDHNTVDYGCDIIDVKPILRTRKSITPEELETFSICFRMWYDKPSFDYNLMVYSDIIQMAKLHIDVFGLIESGLAVDKETIKK